MLRASSVSLQETCHRCPGKPLCGNPSFPSGEALVKAAGKLQSAEMKRNSSFHPPPFPLLQRPRTAKPQLLLFSPCTWNSRNLLLSDWVTASRAVAPGIDQPHRLPRGSTNTLNHFGSLLTVTVSCISIFLPPHPPFRSSGAVVW